MGNVTAETELGGLLENSQYWAPQNFGGKVEGNFSRAGQRGFALNAAKGNLAKTLSKKRVNAFDYSPAWLVFATVFFCLQVKSR